MVDRERDALPPALREATHALRDVPEPGDIWRQRLLREISALPHPALETTPPDARRWSMRPVTAIAAGIVCICIGAGATALAWRAAPRARAPGVAETTRPVVRFTLVAPAASTVSIVGDFNGWNPSALPLRRSADGRTWEVEVPLAPGRYAYAFVVDGALARDPSAPQAQDDDFGSPNSILMVKGS